MATSDTNALIKDLLRHMDPMIYLAGTAENTPEMLAHLADMDPAFHKLDLVQYLRKNLREQVGQSVEFHVERYFKEKQGQMRGENPVEGIIENVIVSQDYEEFMAILQSDLHDAIRDIMNRFHEEVVIGMNRPNQSKPECYSPNESNDSLNCSLNQSGMLFLQPSQYSSIAYNLSRKVPDENRKEALSILISVSPGEPVAQECWHDIRHGLKECLWNGSSRVFEKALKFHSKLLTSQIQTAVKEAYLNLLEAIAGFYIYKKLVDKLPVKDTDIHLINHDMVIRIFKLVSSFMNEFPSIWIRYPQKYVDDMIDATFSLLSLHLKSHEMRHMTVLDLLSCIDSEAKWFQRWTHGSWGQKKSFYAIRNHSVVLTYSIMVCQRFMQRPIPVIQVTRGSVLTVDLVHNLIFIHALNLVTRVNLFSEGRKLFLLDGMSCQEQPFTAQMFLQVCIESASSETSSIFNQISDKLVEFCQSNDSNCDLFCNNGLLEILLIQIDKLIVMIEHEPIKNKCQMAFIILNALLKTVSALLNTEKGIDYILTGRKHATSNHGFSNSVEKNPIESISINTKPMKGILDILLRLFQKTKFPNDIQNQGIVICCHLLQTPLGLIMSLDHSLLTFVAQFVAESPKADENSTADEISVVDKNSIVVESSTDNKGSTADGELCVKFRNLSVIELLPVLQQLLLSFHGIYFLHHHNSLQATVKLVFSHLANRGELDAKLIATVCSTSVGSFIVGNMKVLQPFWEVLCHLTEETEPCMSVTDEEEPDCSLNAALAPLIGLTLSVNGADLLFSNKGLLPLISVVVSTPEAVHIDVHSAALELLARAVIYPEMSAIIQSRIHFQERLLEQQHQYGAEIDGEFLIDKNSLLRNYILVKSYLLGADGELSLPSFEVANSLSQLDSLVRSAASIISAVFIDSEYPPPKECYREIPPTNYDPEMDRWKPITDLPNRDAAWLTRAWGKFRSDVMYGEDVPVQYIMTIIEGMVQSWNSADVQIAPEKVVKIDLEKTIKQPEFKSKEKSEVGGAQILNINIIRYGERLHLLSKEGEALRSDLHLLKEAIGSFVSKVFVIQADWFISILYMLSAGSVERCQLFIVQLNECQFNGTVWSSFPDTEIVFEEILYCRILPSVQLILSLEHPTLYWAHQTSSVPFWPVIGEWVRRAFVGVLPWTEVCHYLLMVLLKGPDFVLYFVVALLRHLQKEFLSEVATRSSVDLMQTREIRDWRLGDHLVSMEIFSRDYRVIVLPLMTVSPFVKMKSHVSRLNR